MTTSVLRSFVLGLLSAHAVSAQPAPTPRPAPGGLQLAALQRAAVEHDPRFRKLQLQETRNGLRLADLSAERKPSISVQALAQYQSDVPTPPPFFPGGQPAFEGPKGTVDLYTRVDQRIWDPTVEARIGLERASLSEAQAGVQSALYALRQEVNDAFFAAALLQQRAGALAATITDLDTRLAEARIRVDAGAMLPSDAAMIEASLLTRRQDEEQMLVDRTTALSRLTVITGQSMSIDTPLDIPDLESAVAAVPPDADTARSRPEFVQFERSRERLARQQDVTTAQDRPRVSAFGRAGIGRPGLNFISDEFEFYALGGIQLQWSPWNWGTSGRQREAYAIDQQIVAADEAAFARTLRVASDADRATVERLRRALALDDRIVLLREDVARTADVRFKEGAITSADYVERSTELLQARFARAGHQVELAQASARLLTTLGREVR
jgi:outer membrane protein TolC